MRQLITALAHTLKQQGESLLQFTIALGRLFFSFITLLSIYFLSFPKTPESHFEALNVFHKIFQDHCLLFYRQKKTQF